MTAVATIIAFGTGGQRDVHRDNGSRTYTRLTGRGINMAAETAGVADQCDRVSLVDMELSTSLGAAVSPDPWWQLWAVPLVLNSILGLTTLCADRQNSELHCGIFFVRMVSAAG